MASTRAGVGPAENLRCGNLLRHTHNDHIIETAAVEMLKNLSKNLVENFKLNEDFAFWWIWGLTNLLMLSDGQYLGS